MLQVPGLGRIFSIDPMNVEDAGIGRRSVRLLLNSSLGAILRHQPVGRPERPTAAAIALSLRVSSRADALSEQITGRA